MKVTKRDAAPAGEPDECFWCNEKIGRDHKWECVRVTKKVIIRETIERTVKVPISWDAHRIEFHRNESSWCASNIIHELQNVQGCLCHNYKAKYLRDADLQKKG